MRIKESELLEIPTIRRVDFDGKWYFALEDVTQYLKEDLSEVETIHLPILVEAERVNVSCATIEDIERGRKNSLTDFDKNIIKALNFNPKKK